MEGALVLASGIMEFENRALARHSLASILRSATTLQKVNGFAAQCRNVCLIFLQLSRLPPRVKYPSSLHHEAEGLVPIGAASRAEEGYVLYHQLGTKPEPSKRADVESARCAAPCKLR